MRRGARAAGVVALGVALAGPAVTQPERVTSASAPEDVPIHDPVLVEADGTWYLFGTGRGIDVWASDDLQEWRRLEPVFPETPPWVLELLPDFRNHIWAPDIFHDGGTYHLYYSVSAFGRNNSAIGVATTPTLDPEDPAFGWTDHGLVVQSVPGRDMWNAIDPHVVRDEAGVPWMSFGSHWGGIELVRLAPDLTALAEPQEWHTIAARHRYWKLDERDAGDSANPELDYETLYPKEILELNRASESGAIEAPTIFFRGGHYYLFVSWDRCCRGVDSTYRVVVGRSPEIEGPYLDREGENMAWGGGTLVTQGFGDSERWAAGGHADVVTISGTDSLVFHAYDAADEGRSKLLIREIRWDEHGWPSVEVEGCCAAPSGAADLERLLYRNPDLVVDLAVGLWASPLPMDYDGDGDMDLVVVCSDKPYNGTWLFENPGGGRMPVFEPARLIGPGPPDVQVSYVGGEPRVLVPGHEYVDFRSSGLERLRRIYPREQIHPARGRVRANQWKYADWEGDGDLDLIVGVGDWTDYGWDDAFDARGNWTRGPLRGFVYLILNRGSSAAPRWAAPERIEAGGRPLEVFGMPSPNLADMDGDGDLDIVCGEFLDRLTYFENVGRRGAPRYARGRFLSDGGEPIRLDLQMIVPVAVDWDADGDVDLVVGEEDGRVALVENTGALVEGAPRFRQPRYFRQKAHEVKFGALATPFSFDWDGDGDEDLLLGNTAGYLGFLENLDGGDPPRWAAPRLLEAGGAVVRIQAGRNGSIQGPAEAKWGYTTPSVADWDGDGRPDVLVNSIWGAVLWYRNVGSRTRPVLAEAEPVRVSWPDAPPRPRWNWWEPTDRQLVTQWRTTPLAVDFDRDGLTDLVMLDHEGFLALYPRRRGSGGLELLPGQRIFVDAEGAPLEMSRGRAGRSGRRKLAIVDWDGDGDLDLLVNGENAELLESERLADGRYRLTNRGPVAERDVSSHSTSPTTVDWNRDGTRDLLLGAEDGHLYYLRR